MSLLKRLSRSLHGPRCHLMAFYPTRIPYHQKSAYLGTHDLFGDFTDGRYPLQFQLN